jgi:hypothetical protein
MPLPLLRDIGTYGLYAALAASGPADCWLDPDLPDLVDETPMVLPEPDLTWSTWLAEDAWWLQGPGSYLSASAHLGALWHSAQRAVVASMVMAVLPQDHRDREHRVLPVLRFIEAAWWVGSSSAGRLHLAHAYAGQPVEHGIDFPPPQRRPK